MAQILWFRRDLRITDNAILANAINKVLPIFIFDKNILDNLEKDDKRVTFIYKSVLELKEKLKTIGLDLAIFYGKPNKIFKRLKEKGFNEVLCSIDFDSYAKKRDLEVEKIIPIRRFIDSFILDPKEHLKKDNTAYKVFTPFYKSLDFITNSKNIQIYKIDRKLTKIEFEYSSFPTLKKMGFEKQKLPVFLQKDPYLLLAEFKNKIENYAIDRDFFYKDSTSNISVHLRFGLISPKEIFNYFKMQNNIDSTSYIRELFFREFYNYILFHFPYSEDSNFNTLSIQWNENEDDFQKWCNGKIGIPIIDAAMIHLNNTGLMHNRLRMVVASFLCKNLFIDWRKGEKYFASKLLDYEASSNIAGWQWSASTGADPSLYFRVFNPYLQSKKFDKDGFFIKKIIPKLKEVDPKLFHIENGISNNPLIGYEKSLVDIKYSRKQAIEKFKRAKNKQI